MINQDLDPDAIPLSFEELQRMQQEFEKQKQFIEKNLNLIQQKLKEKKGDEGIEMEDED